MRNSFKTIGLWVILIVLFLGFYNVFRAPQENLETLTWQSVRSAAQEQRISRVSATLQNGRGAGVVEMLDGTRFKTDSRSLGDFAELEKEGVPVDYVERTESMWLSILAQWLPIVGLFLFFMWFMRKLQGKPAADLLKFPLSADKVTQPVKLEGLTEVRARLRAAADAASANSPGPRRVLIVGPAGSGKTTLLKAAAFDSGLPMLARSGSQFVEVFVGVGAARMRAFFERALADSPCILAIDDVDAFATRRGLPDEKGVIDERATTMLELANRLDGLEPFPPQVLFIATTSRLELIDESILRPGRFELRITLRRDGTASIEELKR